LSLKTGTGNDLVIVIYNLSEKTPYDYKIFWGRKQKIQLYLSNYFRGTYLTYNLFKKNFPKKFNKINIDFQLGEDFAGEFSKIGIKQLFM